MKLTTRSRQTASALLEAVLAAPESDEPRLVYADFVQGRGDPRGEFIAVQCALAALPAKDKRRRTLAQREDERLRAHKKAWSAVAPAGKLTFVRGFAETWKLPIDKLDARSACSICHRAIRSTPRRRA
jgi:uncharacterized protein (TIGR02996 family)